MIPYGRQTISENHIEEDREQEDRYELSLHVYRDAPEQPPPTNEAMNQSMAFA